MVFGREVTLKYKYYIKNNPKKCNNHSLSLYLQYTTNV